MSTLQEALRRHAETFPHLLSRTLWVRVASGVTHASSDGWYGCGQIGVGERVAWADLASRRLCSDCLSDVSEVEWLGRAGEVLAAWSEVEEMTERLLSPVESLTEGERRVHDAERAVEGLLRVCAEVRLFEEERKGVQAFARASRAEQVRVRESLSGDSGRGILLREALAELFLEEEDSEMSPALVGIRGMWRSRDGLERLVELCGVGASEHSAVVMLPRVVADWVVSAYSEYGERGSFTPVVGLLEGEEGLAEVAVGLWDPQSESAMRSLHAAVVAARKVMA